MTGAVPLVRAQPPIKRAKGPHRGHSPGNFLFASGRADHCLTSGGEAGTKMAKSSKTPTSGGEAGTKMAKSSKTPTSGGEAGTKMAKSSKTTHHIGRRSRNEDGQIFEDDSSHRAAKPERRWPNLQRRLIPSGGEAGTKMAKSSKTTPTSGGEAGTKMAKSSKTTHHIRRSEERRVGKECRSRWA